MVYEKFVEEYSNALKEELSMQKAEIRREMINKVNQTLDALIVKYENSLASPTIYLNDKYSLYESGYSINVIAQETLNDLAELKDTMLEKIEFDKEYLKDNLYCVLINKGMNENILQSAPYEELEDLAIVMRCKVNENGSLLVTKSFCESQNLTPEEMFEMAHGNMNSDIYTLKTMEEVMCEILGRYGLDKEYKGEFVSQMDEKSQMYVLSNRIGVDGAAAILSKDIMKKAYEKLDGDFYIIPSSRHEVILLPEQINLTIKEMKDMVCEVNSAEVDIADKLSDNIYYYNGKTLSVADVISRDKNNKDYVKAQTKGSARTI